MRALGGTPPATRPRGAPAFPSRAHVPATLLGSPRARFVIPIPPCKRRTALPEGRGYALSCSNAGAMVSHAAALSPIFFAWRRQSLTASFTSCSMCKASLSLMPK